MRYDLAIVGGGAAGFRAACAARDAGLSVLLFEQGAAGGNVNTSGHYAMERTLRELEKKPSYAALNTAVREAADQTGAAIRHHLMSRGVLLVEEPAALRELSPGGFSLHSLEERFEADNVLLATGSLPRVPDVDGIDRALEEGFAVTHHDILGAKKLRVSAAVLGGSLKGVQMALYYALLNVPSVLLEPAAADGSPGGPAPEMDAEIARCLGSALEDVGVRRVPFTRLESVGQGRVSYLTSEGERETLETNALVLGAQRQPATRGMGLSELGVSMENGAVRTDASGHTGVPGLYAAGDCTLRSLSSESARRQAEQCVAAITGRTLVRFPSCTLTGIFAGGQAVSIGETEESALAKRLHPAVIKLPIPYTANTPGLVKLVGTRHGGRLIGAHIAGKGTEFLASCLTPAIESGLRIRDIRMPGGTLEAEITAEALFRLNNKLK